MSERTNRGPIAALILCGGLGTRLRPVTGDLPKVLVPVAGRPFLDYVLCYLQSQGVYDVVLGTGYGARQVVDFCRDGSQWNMRIAYSEEVEPLGTGGAIKHAEHLISSNPFWVLNGDSLVKADLARLRLYHSEKNAQLTIALAAVQDRERYGSVILTDDGLIHGFHEKGEKSHGVINAGLYLMDHTVLGMIPPLRRVSLEHDIFPLLAGKSLYGLLVAPQFIDIGIPESYAVAQDLLPSW